MSVKVMHLVWQNARSLSGNDLLVMLALADWSDDRGICWPSVPSLAQKARVAERTVRYVLDRLQADNYITRIEQRGRTHTNQYLLNLQVLEPEKVQPLQVLEPIKPANDDIKPASSDIKPAIAIAPEPLQEPTINHHPKKERALSFPADFTISFEMERWAVDNLPNLDIAAATEEWADAMRSNTTKYRYTNWETAWRNAMRRAVKWAARDEAPARRKSKAAESAAFLTGVIQEAEAAIERRRTNGQSGNDRTHRNSGEISDYLNPGKW